MTTSSSTNSYLSNGYLYLNPTLTAASLSQDAIFDGTVYNITDCTFNLTAPNNGFLSLPNGQNIFDQQSYLKACSAVSNKTTGTVINPVMSARLSTKFSASLKYGRVEIRAKMPNGSFSLFLLLDFY